MPTEGWACLGIIAVFLLMVPITAALERRRRRRAEAAFLRGRRGMPDAAFLARAGAGADEVSFFLAARHAMAELCGVPADMIQTEDTVRSLLNLQWDCGFIDDFVFALQDRVGGRLPLGYPPERMTFGNYLRELHRQGAPPATEQASRA
jgi:hypothetical protein